MTEPINNTAEEAGTVKQISPSLEYYYKHRDRDRDKRRSRTKKWKKDNPSTVRDQRRRRRAAKAGANFVWEYKEKHPCSYPCCTVSHPAMLDFHHLDPNKKSDRLARLTGRGRSLESIKAEIDKCIVLCANHHRLVHYEATGK